MMIMNILKTGIFISVALPSSVMFLVLMECRAQLTSSKLICENLDYMLRFCIYGCSARWSFNAINSLFFTVLSGNSGICLNILKKNIPINFDLPYPRFCFIINLYNALTGSFYMR